MRDAFGKALIEIGEQRKDVVVLTGFAQKTRTHSFEKKYPQQFINCGEQNVVGIATGLALQGKVPYIATDNVDWNQLRNACISNANIKIVATHTGFSQGASEQVLEDVALLRTLPNMTIIVPSDAEEASRATIAASVIKGPVYIRLNKAHNKTRHKQFTIGRAETLQEGNDCTIVACGRMVQEALQAAKKLAQHNIFCTVINNHTIKPLDKHAIISAAQHTGCMITVEEHQIHGGLGSAIAEVLSHHSPIPLLSLGVKDTFGESGTQEDLYNEHGLTSREIIKAVKNIVARKARPIAPGEHFHLHKGGTVKNIHELYTALTTMSAEIFKHHVSGHKNDFSKWVKEVLHNRNLAKQLTKCRTKENMISMLHKLL